MALDVKLKLWRYKPEQQRAVPLMSTRGRQRDNTAAQLVLTKSELQLCWLFYLYCDICIVFVHL